MVRAGFRTKLALKFPPFVVQCREHALIVAGGGGDSNTGVPNQIVPLIIPPLSSRLVLTYFPLDFISSQGRHF